MDSLGWEWNNSGAGQSDQVGWITDFAVLRLPHPPATLKLD